MTGLELIRAIFEGRLDPPGVSLLLGMHGVEAEEGRTVFALTPGQAHTNPGGIVHGGILATMLDSAMTCAVHTTLPEGQWPTTLDISIRYLRAVPPGTGELRAEGRAIQVGRSVGTAEGRVTGADGTLYATGTTSCMILNDA